ncbi:hypothetical protein EMA8858_02011 [Emticicia aquatica]|uniref:Secreted protein (Por secretion system target) n=1 Tax=Emticicia aquatica TaxID=1681835 RepID=A0ABM9ARG2_9BACT|nr:zinc-dependent metalloprotease [Emticicia aquatica]CAH0995883.1 hypothetical protein EMA8858_02011 [Emticicia aquatica]
MKKVKILSFVLLLLFGQGENLYAQFNCGLPNPSDIQKKESFDLFQKYIRQKKAKLTTYKVAVKANVISANNTANFLSENDIRAIISNANLYLQNINVQLYLLNDKVYQIKDDKYADFKIADENALRQINDVPNAINIYFVKKITLQDLTILSGYASLPTTSASSNRIFYSYFERSEDDFTNLKDKTFLHELGHYFGLFHTFQDSNNSDIKKRELVTRGNGSNCVSTGDQLCDTAADPFERLPLISAYNCTETAPADIVDANGDIFSPPIDNIMSYHQRCGNVFTEQQYQKMQASFAIRFSPLAEYQIVPRNPNFVIINNLDKKVYCIGDSLRISFNLEGLFENNNQLFVEISDQFGKNYQKIDARLNNEKLVIKLPDDFPEGDNYRVQLTATRPETTSAISENFAIRTYPGVTLSAENGIINSGESTNLIFNFSGSGPWDLDLSDSTFIKNIRQNSYQIAKSPLQTTTYSIISARNMCGEGIKGNATTINVVQPQILAEALSTSTVCQGQNIKLSIAIIGKLSSSSQLVIQISDTNGHNFTDLPTQVSLFTLSAQIPSTFQVGSGYRIKVLAKNSDYFSSILGPFTIIAPPSPPIIAENFLYCQNSNSEPLFAEGTNLKWYMSELDIKSFQSITPPTGNEGVLNYYVSQTNAYGCESKKIKTTVTIKPLILALINGDATVLKGDSALIQINFTGELPAEIKLSDGRTFVCNQNPFTIEVKPLQSSTYTLKEVQNACGFGTVLGSATITISEPLATEENSVELINVYPNPTNQQVNIDFLVASTKSSNIILSDNNGKVLQQKRLLSSESQQEIFDFKTYSSGIYFLKIIHDKKTIIKKIVLEK